MKARIIARRATLSYIARISCITATLSACSNGAVGATGSDVTVGDGGQINGTGGASDDAPSSSTSAGGAAARPSMAAAQAGKTGAGGAKTEAEDSGVSAGGASAAPTQSAGGAAASAGGAAASAGGASSSGSGSTQLVNPPPGSDMFMGANFWNIDWEPQEDFFKPNTNFATTTDPWQPALIDSLKPYHVIRFMDWNMTNFSNNPQANWSTRKLKTQPQNEPVAFEWQIDLCNRTKKDYWVNIPHEAGPEMWTNLAKLIKEQLDPSLRVYVEWSNEVWNGGFPVRQYGAQKAQQLGLPGDDGAFAYQAYESVRVFEAFEAVFGKDNPRLVKVIAGQTANRGVCDKLMAALDDPKINPKGTKADAYAGAPYFTGNSISELQSAIPVTAEWTKSSKTCSDAADLPIISYEGGSDSFAAGNQGCEALQNDPGMRGLYTSYLNAHAAAGHKGPFMQYTHVGTCWGLKTRTSDPDSSAPKYQGMLDWIKAHPVK